MGRVGRAALLAIALGPAPADAECRLALLLALDVSASVDAAEDRLQREGLAGALRTPEVVAAAFSVPGSNVALAAFEWSGRYQQDILLDWTLLLAPDDLFAAAGRISGSRRGHDDAPTAMGYALGFSAGMLTRAPDCLFRTLDVSGDGINNEGFGPALAYANFPFEEITVNGLAIGGSDPDVIAFYKGEVLHGPGAFLEIARDYDDFERAMRRKLEREMRAIVLGAAP